MTLIRHFDKDIEEIKDMLLRMGAMVEDAIQQSIRALLEGDLAIAEQVIANDDRIDQMEIQIDQHVIELIAKMQPAAGDLRFVATVMKITPELERIADLAQDVCERVMELSREPTISQMFVAPSAIRSKYLPMKVRRMAAAMFRGFSIMYVSSARNESSVS